MNKNSTYKLVEIAQRQMNNRMKTKLNNSEVKYLNRKNITEMLNG